MASEQQDRAHWRALAERAREVTMGYEWQYAETHACIILRALGAPVVCQMVPDDHVDDPGSDDIDNGRFIAASSPNNVLALLDRVAALEAALDEIDYDLNANIDMRALGVAIPAVGRAREAAAEAIGKTRDCWADWPDDAALAPARKEGSNWREGYILAPEANPGRWR